MTYSPASIRAQIDYCETADKQHGFDCPSCNEATNKHRSQEACEHCGTDLSHRMMFIGGTIITEVQS